MPLYRGSRRLILQRKASTIVGPPVLTFITATGPSSFANPTYTFTATSLGPTTGFTTRRIIVAMSGAAIANPPIASATINLVAATVHVSAGAAGSNPGVGIFSAAVPTGTTGDITITLSGNNFTNPQIAIYSVDDALLISTTPSVGSASTGSSVTSLATSSFTQTAGGFVVATNAVITNAGGTGTSIAGFTIDALGGAGNKEYLAHLSSVPSTVTGTVTSNWTTANAAAIAVAAWR